MRADCRCPHPPPPQGVGQPKVYDGSWVAALNAAGFSVAGIDNRGCGRSDGLFGHIHDFDELVADVVRRLLAVG